jgi:hypothetical protein
MTDSTPTIATMTVQERQQQFRDLFASMPGRNIEKIRKVCSILHLKENTIRLYLMRTPSRTIPERSLKILRDALAGQAS